MGRKKSDRGCIYSSDKKIAKTHIAAMILIMQDLEKQLESNGDIDLIGSYLQLVGIKSDKIKSLLPGRKAEVESKNKIGLIVSGSGGGLATPCRNLEDPRVSFPSRMES
jgi:hypothetical protein